ncbi:DUF1016 N-terminal domain-containing protein [Micrococcaceae bacterium Sec5.7]
MKPFAEAWPDFRMLQTVSATLPWSHHVLLIEKVPDSETKLWYMAQTVANGWSHAVLGHHIETKLHEVPAGTGSWVCLRGTASAAGDQR